MMGLTPRQAQVLEILKASGDVMPTVREIKDRIGTNSTSTVTRALNALEERGRIRRLRGKHRAIEVLDGGS